jgi:peptidyl-prolyl cis-trans isomerase C
VNGLLIVLALLLVVGMAYQFVPSLSGGGAGGLFGRQTGTPALRVDGATVTVEELEAARRSNPVLASTDTGLLGDDFKTYVVSQSVRRALYTQAASDINVSRQDVDAEVKKFREARSLTDNKAWTDALQGAGLTDAAYRTQVRDQLAVQRKVESLQKDVPAATTAEAQTYYDLNQSQYQSDARIVGRQIVVADRAKADALLTQARAQGADFAALASANSTEFKDRGGALGPVENGSPRPVAQVALPTEVGEAAFALQSGGVTDVIPSGGKFYIVKVERYLAPATRPFSEVSAQVQATVTQQKKDAVVEKWLDGLQKDAKIEYVDPAWKAENPTVATVSGQNIPYADVVEQVVNNQQIAQIFQQLPAEQVAGLVNTGLKPQIVQQLISGYAAPAIAEKLKLDLVGTRQEIASALSAYGARDVKVADSDVQAFYRQNVAQFETPGSATVDEASFATRTQAEAFRTDWDGQGEFVAAATRAGGTVSERGAVTSGDQKLGTELETAVFGPNLRSVGEGSLSPVVPAGQRFSVAYVTDLKRATTQPLSAVRAQIEEQVLASKKSEAGQKFIAEQVAALKPTNRLQTVLDAQAKRVAAAAPKTTTPATGTGTPATGTPATGTPATETPAEGGSTSGSGAATQTPATETPATGTPATETPTTPSAP